MFPLPDLMRNCDIWSTTATIDKTLNSITFSIPTLLYRTELSAPAIDSLLNWKSIKKLLFVDETNTSKDKLKSKTNDSNSDDNVVNDIEPMCRICQVYLFHIFIHFFQKSLNDFVY